MRKVHLIFKTHLDVGFTDFASRVLEHYLTSYILQALDVAAALRKRGGSERFVWTTGSWLIDEFLQRSTPPERERMEAAIRAGDIVWHGLPFTTHSELMDPSLFRFGLSISHDLDQRFGRSTVAAKMTDVPGHTRGIVPLLAEAGIAFLHIGVNPASTPPDVPPVFVWRAPDGSDVMVMYQRGSYGDVTTVPGLDEAIAFAHTNDNHGPQSVDDVIATFAALRERFPGAEIVASTMDDFARALLSVKQQLPVITDEIGDTWIHGTGTDPLKISQFRELARLRRTWLDAGQVQADDPQIAAFSRLLLLVPEHTWGMDEKTHLADYTHYEPQAFRTARQEERFRIFESSWDEQRGYLRDAVAALGDSSLAQEARASLAALAPVRPNLADWARVAESSVPWDTAHFTLGFDPHYGALTRLVERATGRDWAASGNPMALIQYETFGQAEYDRFYSQYIINKQQVAAWAVDDYTKPGMASAGRQHALVGPTLTALYTRHEDHAEYFLLDLAGPDGEATDGCPRRFTLELRLPHDEPTIEFTLQWFDKPASRLPEALWLSFVPSIASSGAWHMNKLGQQISPREVVRNGNRHLHAVGSGATYSDRQGRLTIETLDAPLVAPGAPSLLDFNNKQPRAAGGMYINLYNNVWGTNFPMWYDENARFRFVVRTR